MSPIFWRRAIKLIVEVDGAIHARQVLTLAEIASSSAPRFRIVRISAQLVLSDLPAAVARVRAAL